MKITAEQIYSLAGLKLYDKIRISKYNEIWTLSEKCLLDKDGEQMTTDALSEFDFEKVETKIWNLDDININDKYWFVSSEGFIHFEKYSGYPHEDDIIKSIAFKEERYAKEYKDKLIQFTTDYKKECE